MPTVLWGRAKERCDRRPIGDWERATCCFAKALLNLHGNGLIATCRCSAPHLLDTPAALRISTGLWRTVHLAQVPTT